MFQLISRITPELNTHFLYVCVCVCIWGWRAHIFISWFGPSVPTRIGISDAFDSFDKANCIFTKKLTFYLSKLKEMNNLI